MDLGLKGKIAVVTGGTDGIGKAAALMAGVAQASGDFIVTMDADLQDDPAEVPEMLAKLLAGGRLSMANVDAVPAGKYGKAALEKLGAWNGVKDRIAQAENVRAALLLVSRGEAPLGIVYATDAQASDKVRIAAIFTERSHPPIRYPLARLKASTSSMEDPRM